MGRAHEPGDNGSGLERSLHGITTGNVHEFVVESVLVNVVVYRETEPRGMWLVLREHQTDEGYVVAFDPSSRCEVSRCSPMATRFALVSGLCETFVDAVEGM